MEAGSIVLTVGNFEELRRTWNFPYPKKGDVLTVVSISKHPNRECRSKGIVLLTFEEIPNLCGVCDKDIYGNINFTELMLPESIKEVLNEELKQTTEVNQ